jgi:pyruvate formate lyase activating enzyme
VLRRQCRICGQTSVLVADILSLCADCIRTRPVEAREHVQETHAAIRQEFGLPTAPPRTENGIECPLCVNACRLGDGELGLCGLRTAQNGRLVHLAGTPAGALVSWYDDPLPTNCVAAWVCEGSRIADAPGGRGKVNLAVFYEACTFTCLSCQNWHFRLRHPPGRITADELAAQAHRRTHCVCYFGGDPTPQMLHALAVSRILAEQGVTVCWETNGSMDPALLDQALELSLQTGGCIKFDLKAADEHLHVALTGVSNRRTLENFHRAVRFSHQRPSQPPLVVASTLLVPGYVDTEEVRKLAGFVAELDPDTPYTLLGFYPHFYLPDLPCTSVRHAKAAEAAAREAGLTRVRVGNRHLLSQAY